MMNHAATMITATLILALLVLLVATESTEPFDDPSGRRDAAIWPRSSTRRQMAGFGDPALHGAASPRPCQAVGPFTKETD